MYVLHAVFSEAGFWELWAEDSTRPLTVPAQPGRGARAAARRTTAAARPAGSGAADLERHPYAAQPADLARLLASAGGEVEAAVRKADPRGSVVLVLPGTAGPEREHGPVPSPDFARLAALPRPAAGTAAAAVTLRGWIVPSLALDPGDGAALLAALDGDRLTAYDTDGSQHALPLGADLKHARAVSRFAEDLVGRGQILPGLEHDEETGEFYAVWRPAHTAVDVARHRKALIDAMPPVSRAQMLGADAEGRAAETVLDEALDALVDAYVVEAFAGPHGLQGESLAPPRPGRRPAMPTVTELWLEALTSASGNQLDVEQTHPEPALRLMKSIEQWRTAETGGHGPVRTCFRLVAPGIEPGAGIDSGHAGDPGTDDPGAEDGRWRVELLLQSTEDPSLLATAREVWQRGGAARLLRDIGAKPYEDLLAGLGRAARVFPALARALRETTPEHVPLDDEGAHEFLRKTAPALAGNGFGVLLPSWWTAGAPEITFSLTTGAPTPQPGRVELKPAFGLEQLLDFEWRASLDGRPLTDEEFEALTAAKSGLVRLRGQWVEVDQARIALGLKALGKRRRGRMRAGEVLRTAMLGLDDQSAALGEVEADGWLGDLLSGVAEQRCAPASAPPGLHATLRPYQERGVGWLGFMDRLGLGAVLADSMGLGKTIQVLTVLEQERAARQEEAAAAGAGRSRAEPGGSDPGEAEPTQSEPGQAEPEHTLLICPMSLVANWQREAARFTPDVVVHVHHGAERLSGDQFRLAVADAHLVVTTYGLALRDHAELAAVSWHRIVVDEAQAIKNAATKQARAVRALRAPHRIALTGTPVENRLADLWSIMEFANPGLLGTAEAFKERFAKPIERHGDEEAAERLRRATGAFVLRRLKSDPSIIDDLPEKVEMKVVCNLTKEQASLYQATVDRMLAEIAASEGIARRGQVLSMLTALKQICNHPAHFLKDGSRLPGRSGKLARVEELCDEVLAAGEKALLFTQYAEFGTLLQHHLAARFGREVSFLHGGVPKKARDAMVARFEQPDGPPLFVLSIKAGGVGLNLTAANHVVHVDRWWNPAVEDQATDRAFRIGQRKNVQVRKLMCAGTLEERIDQVIEQKKDLAERIVGTGESWLAELSVADLREVVTLAADAVVE
jgi:SNF2-related domain/SNF2 Helicase protein/Helicase conserved C-terminal domain